MNIIFTTSQLATEWISTFLSFASERSSRNLVAIFPLGTGSLNGLLLPPNPNPHLTSEKSFNNKIIRGEKQGVNAIDVIGWGWGLGEGLLETPQHQQETKRTWLLPVCQYWGGGAQPKERQSFQSLRREGWRARFSVLSGLVSKMVRVFCLAPSAKYLFWGRHRWLGRRGQRCSAPWSEAWAKLRQFTGRHFNCGFQYHRGPYAAGEGGGDRA